MNSVMLINLLLNTHCDLDPAKNFPRNYSSHLNDGEHFDFIVVGGGTAGAIVANRLSENQHYRVLLLEAGGLPTVTTEVPSFWFRHINTDIDWNYNIEPGNFSLSYKELRLPRGKMLGGCSSFNGLTYVRSPPSDYDTWASMGNSNWDWKSILKYFQKAEHATSSGISENYGRNGPLFINKENVTDPLPQKIIQACNEANVEVLKEEGGAGLFQIFKNIINGTRCSTAKAYLSDLKRNNLHVGLGAHVVKVVFKKNRATGVKVLLPNRKIIKLHAKKEVILSAGAVNTPQILMLSGIGPSNHLKTLGIHVKANLQVGRNLYDHYIIRSIFVKLNPDDTKAKSYATEDAIEYCLTRGGAFSKFGVQTLQWSLGTKNESDPNMFIMLDYTAKQNSDGTLAYLRSFAANIETLESFKELNSKYDILSFSIGIAKPKSSGSITLKSKDPFEKPVIKTNYLSDKNNEDIQAFVSTIKHIKKLLETPTMKKLNATIAKIKIPNCEHLKFDTDDYYECLVRNLGSTGCHLTSTCKMGPTIDPEAVVDPRLRVIGCTSLRVIDASVMPVIPSMNTLAPTVMIAEKGAELVKEDWEHF